MNLSEYILKPRSERITHADLATPCMLGEEHRSVRQRRARKSLLALLGITNDIANWKSGRINMCHLCQNDSKRGWCENPEHIYIGTMGENQLDLPPEVRAKGGITCKVNQLGIHAPGEARRGGLKGGIAQGKVKRVCLVSGHISTPAGLAVHQRANGVPTYLYAGLDGKDIASKTVLLGLASNGVF